PRLPGATRRKRRMAGHPVTKADNLPRRFTNSMSAGPSLSALRHGLLSRARSSRRWSHPVRRRGTTYQVHKTVRQPRYMKMPDYCVNKTAQSNGDHEVHDLTPGACHRLPEAWNRLDLGYHSECSSAVRKAKETYRQSNGCYHCCRACHTASSQAPCSCVVWPGSGMPIPSPGRMLWEGEEAMPLSWSEIRDRARAFSREWANEAAE